MNQAAIEAQKAIDESNRLGLNAIEAPFPQRRVNDLLYKAGAPGTPYASAMKLLDQPVVTLTQAFHDDHIKTNAEARWRAGMGPKIVRRAAGKCCDWCARIAGSYDYDDVRDTGNDVFRRHENCRCSVDYICDGKAQDVWSKKFFAPDEETMRERLAHRLQTTKKTPSEMDADFIAWQEQRKKEIHTLQERAEYHTSTGDKSLEELRIRSEYGLAIGEENDIIKTTNYKGFGSLFGKTDDREKIVYDSHSREQVDAEFLASLPRLAIPPSFQQAVWEANINDYENNCQRSIAAMIMRLRQYDVVASPSFAGDDLGLHTEEIFFNFHFKTPETNNPQKEITDYLLQEGHGAIVEIVGIVRNKPHSFAACNENGNILFGDPMTGEKSAGFYFDKFTTVIHGYGRIDRLPFSNLVKHCIEVKKE